MLKSIWRVAAGTVLFAAVHSLLASRQAKEAAARLAGPRARNGLYRVFYIGGSFATLAGLGLYLRSVPDRVLYRVKRPWSLLFRAGQALALAYATYAAAQIGLLEVTGLRPAAEWLTRNENLPPEPEAQGPRAGADGRMAATGPFRWSRHPLNFAPVPIFWLMPTMTLRLAAFSAVGTLYLMLGSFHEEARLRAAYGRAYEAYQESGTSFYIPAPPPT